MDWLLLIPGVALVLWVVALARLLLALLESGRAYECLPDGAPPLLFRCLWWPLIALAHVLAPLLRAPWRVRLMQRLSQAGVSRSLEPGVWAALQVLLVGTATLLLTLELSGIDLVALCVIPACALLPELWLRARIRTRRRELLQAWPAHLELLSLGLDAGCSFTLMAALLAAHARATTLRGEWQLVQSDLRAGRSRQEALLRMERRVGIAVISSSLAALDRSDEGAARLADALRAQAAARADARTARLELLLRAKPLPALLPALACAAPGLVALLLVPIAAWLEPALLH